jgi:hypothetical protein
MDRQEREKKRLEQRRRRKWEEFGRDILERVAEGLDYWCYNVIGDPLLECYQAHQGMSLYELAELFSDWSVTGIGKKDLEMLEKMPEDIYEKFNKEIQRRIDRVVKQLEKERKKTEKELGEKFTW